MTRTELRALVAEMQRRNPDLEITLRPRMTAPRGPLRHQFRQVDVTVRVTQTLNFAPNDPTSIETVQEMVQDEIDALREGTGERVRAIARHTRLLRERGHNPIAQRLLDTPLAATGSDVWQPPPLTQYQPPPPADPELTEALVRIFQRHDTVNRYDVQRRLFPRVGLLEYDTAFMRAMDRARDEHQRVFRPQPHIGEGLYVLQDAPQPRVPSQAEFRARLTPLPRAPLMPTEMAILPDQRPRDRPHLMLRPPVSVPIEPGMPRRPVTMPEPTPAGTEPAPEAQSLWERLEES